MSLKKGMSLKEGMSLKKGVSPQEGTSLESLSVVVPVLNEVENLGPLYRSVSDVLEQMGFPYELIFVDDGSTDGSLALLQELAAEDAHVKILELARNFGQTAAMSAGIDAAIGDVIVTMDGDQQNDPEDIPQMVAKLREGYDLVHGWRKHRQDALLNRKIPSRIANWLIARVTGFPVHDLGCTLKVIRREQAKDLKMYGQMHRFIPILAHWQGARCVEVVARHHPRRFGQTKYGICRTGRVLLDLLTVKYLINYSVSPMRLFGGIGLACLAVSFAAGTTAVGTKLLHETDMTDNPLLLLAVFSGVVAMQFLVLGLLGEVAVRIYHECQDKRPYRIRAQTNLPQPQLLRPATTRRKRAA